MSRCVTLLLVALLTFPLALTSAEETPASDDGVDVPAAELRDAMRSYFQNRLRRELALTDDQVAVIVPRIQGLEEAKRESRREKGETARQLHRGLEHGATDGELQALLDRLDAIQLREQEQEREIFAGIDESLSVRQRVQLRFFVQRFRRDMMERMSDIRGERGRGEHPRRRPPGQRP